MNAMIMNTRIVNSIFDDEKFRNELISALNELIVSELAKQDSEISFELIDIYSEALNRIYNGEDIDKIFMTLQTVEEMRDFINADKRFTLLKRAAKITLAACAVLALTLTANSVAEETTGYNFLEKMAQAVKSVFTGSIVNNMEDPFDREMQTEKKTEKAQESTSKKSEEGTTDLKVYAPVVPVTEPSSQSSVSVPQVTQKPQNPNLTQVLSPETTATEPKTEPTTREPFTRPDDDVTAAPVVIKLTPQYGEGFKRNYTVGEEADFTGLTVIAVYDNGTQKNISVSECKIYGFSTATPANRIVTVEYEGCSFSYLIRVEEEK